MRKLYTVEMQTRFFDFARITDLVFTDKDIAEDFADGIMENANWFEINILNLEAQAVTAKVVNSFDIVKGEYVYAKRRPPVKMVAPKKTNNKEGK